MENKISLGAAVVAALFLSVISAQAADPAVKCEAGKLKESSKYGACRLKADAKSVLKNLPADYTKCETKFADKWAKTEDKAGPGVCPTEGDVGDIDADITSGTTRLAIVLAGGTVPDFEAELIACEADLAQAEADLATCEAAAVTALTFQSTVTYVAFSPPAGVVLGDTVTFTVQIPNTASSTVTSCDDPGFIANCTERDFDLGTVGYHLAYSSGYEQFGTLDIIRVKDGGCIDFGSGCETDEWEGLIFYDGSNKVYEVVVHAGSWQVGGISADLRAVKDDMLIPNSFWRTHYWGNWGGSPSWGTYHYDYSTPQNRTIVTEQ